MLGVADYEFPFPARAGKQRHVKTVDQSTFESWGYRPTSNQAQSLFRTAAWSKNNWFSSPYASRYSEKQMRAESKAKAAKVGGNEHHSFEPIVDILRQTAETAHEFRSIADQFMVDWGLNVQSVNPGSNVVGRPVAVTETNYTGIDREAEIKQKMKTIEGTLDTFVRQVKGLFNTGYPTNVVSTPSVAEAETQPTMPIWLILAIIFLVMVAK